MASFDKYYLPDDLYYDRDSHIWARYQDGKIVLGLDMLGQESMGDLAYISFEPAGREVQRGQVIGSIEAAKMVAPLVAPVSGRIVDKNDQVARTPNLIRDHPYDEGWLVVMELTDWETESAQLISGPSRISRFLLQETARYREQGWIG